MAATQSLYLAFDLIAIINESLLLGTRNLH
jgi:hypothetical protein